MASFCNSIRATVLSRASAVEYCKHKHDEPSVIISISDPYGEYQDAPFKDEQNGVADILPLSFVDADSENGDDVYGRVAKASDLLQDEDAMKIVKFVSRHLDKRIIVHCDAGISRSAGVAAALLKFYNDDDSIFDSRYFCPNILCYRKVLKKLYEVYVYGE